MSTFSRLSQQLFVELDLDHEHHYFEFRPNDDRAVMVGSSPQANWCVDRHGVSPVAFHLEREHDEIHVTPGYGIELRLNSRVVKRRAALTAHAMLEFQGIALQVRILKEVPAGEPPIRSTVKRCRSDVHHQVLDCATVPVDRGGLLDHDTEPVQYFMTEVIPVVPPEVAFPKSLDTQTTAFETVRLPSPGAAKAPAAQPSLAPRSTAWLTRLGLLTKAKPLPVLVTTLGVALLLGVLAASSTPFFTSAPATERASGAEKTSATSSLAARAQGSPESAASSFPSRSRALVAKVAGSNASAPERKGSLPKTTDPDLARAVTALGAGRYAEAAQVYSSVAARTPDSEVYRAIARLLEKASSAACSPSRPAKPACPEVQP